MNTIKLARDLMYARTKLNKAPSWLLTELAVRKGAKLAKKYRVDPEIVQISLYLAHTIFSRVWQGKIQEHHEQLSANFVKPYLKKWQVSPAKQDIILNAIEAHHAKRTTKSKAAEVVKNAECFKFVTVEGALISFHEFGIRGISMKESVSKVIQKMEQKLKLLTLSECKKEAAVNCREIRRIFKVLETNQ